MVATQGIPDTRYCIAKERYGSSWKACLLRRTFQRVMGEAALMGNLVRVSDYMIAGALAQRAAGMSSDLLTSLQTESSSKADSQVTHASPTAMKVAATTRRVLSLGSCH